MGSNVRYIFVTGGVVSSLGKGIATASLGALLQARGLKVTCMKLDPYINLDPGTMSPLQHGEVFVLNDGAETDLDLGYYERFLSQPMAKKNNITCGQIYDWVMRRERRGEYLGQTVQVTPHITDAIAQRIEEVADDFDIVLVEIGGTVGDIESLPFLEAIRQMRVRLGIARTLFVHLTLVPYVEAAGELKTKPTQHSVKELRSIGIQPDILLCRTLSINLSAADRDKIALFTNVSSDGVISVPNVDSIYQIPMELMHQGVDKLVAQHFGLTAKQADLTAWQTIVAQEKAAQHTIKIALVGKYTELSDAYKSVIEALQHAGLRQGLRIDIQYLAAEAFQAQGAALLGGVSGIIVPGGFGNRGVAGLLSIASYAYHHKIPYFGICLGMQIAVIQFAREQAGLAQANSAEFDPDTQCAVIDLVKSWQDNEGNQRQGSDAELGGTMRLGRQLATAIEHTHLHRIYGQATINERHRHRYELNQQWLPALKAAGLVVSAVSSKDNLVDAIELPDHPWYIGVQYHPEFQSSPRNGHVLFTSFVQAARAYREHPVSTSCEVEA